jgi:ABC-type Fe3+/spermidine/putrescine transport system ATPase subunit
MTYLELDNLSKTYPGNTTNALHNLSLAVQRGELVALLGPSGCGKTTTLKLIAGLLMPTSGTIRCDGQLINGLAPERRGVAMVFQKPLLFPHMNVADNIAFGLQMRCEQPATIRRRVGEMLELVQLPGYEKRRPNQLSGGQEQRISLARALVVAPQLLLLDEPLSQLDAALRVEMRELIVRIQRELRITTLFVTHDQEEAVTLADRIALLFEGRLQQYDGPRGFYERPASARVARFFGGQNFMAGHKHGARFRSALGEFALNGVTAPDGPGLLTIRPEAVALHSSGENSLRGIVRQSLYLGTQTRYWISVGEHEIQALTDPSRELRPGEEISLTLPRERLWVVSED